MTDQPIQPPASRLERWTATLGNLARPFAIYVTSAAAAWAIVLGAQKITTGEGGALYIAAVLAGLAGLYWGKSWEQAKTSAAEVEIAKANSPIDQHITIPDRRARPAPPVTPPSSQPPWERPQ